MLTKRRLATALGFAALIVVVLALLALTRGSEDSQAGGLVQGDADCNQVVNASDALAALAAAADVETPAACVHLAGNVDCNETVDAAAAAAILKYSAFGGGEGIGGGNCPPIGAVVATFTPAASPTGTGGSASAARTSSPTPTPTATPGAGAGTSTDSPSGSLPPVTSAPATGAPGPCAGPGGGPGLPSGSIGSPQAGAYDAQEALSESYLGNAADAAIEFALIPGRPNEVIIAKQSGYLYRVALDQSFAPQLWGDVHTLLDFGGEEGLLSFAFSPDYQNDCRVYLYYTRGSPQPSVLSRFTATPTGGLNEASEEVLITTEQPYAHHNGGHIVFGNDGY
ncbi:MAG: PQQ-dependent sugar dehydrogenase, partial [Chloroflexota bacterium]